MQVTLTSLDYGVIAVYVALLAIIALRASRNAGNSRREYFLAGDRLPWWMIGGSIVAANISSHHLVGVMGVAYARGFSAIAIEWATVLLGLNALLWLFLPYYLRNGFYTMPEYLLRRYGGAARTLFAFLVLVTYLFVEISAVLYLGAIALHALLGLPIRLCVPVIAAATGVYTVFGGLRAVIWTEMLQLAVLLLGGIALAVATLHASGGVGAFVATMPQWHLLLPADDPDFPWTMYLGGLTCISVFYCAANQFIVQRVLAARSEWDARMGVVFTDYLKFLLPVIIIVPGLLAPRLFPNLERPDMVFPTLVTNLLPPGLVGLVLAGLLSAVMSHLSGAVNSCATIATLDIVQPWRPMTDAKAVRFGRIAGCVFLLLGVVGAELLSQRPDRPVFLYLLNAYGYFTPGIAVMFLAGILWRRANHAGALAAGALTIPLSLAFEWLVPQLSFFNRTGIVFWLCAAVCVVVSLCTRAPAPAALAGLVWERASAGLPSLDARSAGWRNPFWWWLLITMVILFFYLRFP